MKDVEGRLRVKGPSWGGGLLLWPVVKVAGDEDEAVRREDGGYALVVGGREAAVLSLMLKRYSSTVVKDLHSGTTQELSTLRLFGSVSRHNIHFWQLWTSQNFCSISCLFLENT